MSHGYHDALPGYSPDHLLADGCAECEERSRRPDRGISSLDPQRFARAWLRADELQAGVLTTVSAAEYPMLCTLGAVRAQLEQTGLLLRVDRG